MQISVSDLKIWLRCPQEFYYRCVLRRGVMTTSTALTLGTAFHEVMASKLKGEDWEKRGNEWDLALDAKEAEQWGRLFAQVKNWQVPKSWEILEVEEQKAIQLGKHTLNLTLDAVIRDSGEVYDVQWKTTESHRKDLLLESVRFGFHECLYERYVREAYGSCQGTAVGLAEKRPATLVTATGKRVRNDLGDGYSVDLVHVTRDQATVTRRLTDLERKLDEIETTLSTLGPSQFQNTESCRGPFYNSKCAYWHVCHGGRQIDGDHFVDIEPRYQLAAGEPQTQGR